MIATDLISVIVTTFNREDALDLVLAALAAQSDPNFEIVIADDGSGPQTGRLIESWKRRFALPLKHVRHEHRGFRGGDAVRRVLERDRFIRPHAEAVERFEVERRARLRARGVVVRADERRAARGERVRPPREMFIATCAECGQPARLPFQPRLDKPVYCSSCFDKVRGTSSSTY